MRNIQTDYSTEVYYQDGLLDVAAMVIITERGDCYLEWWDVEGNMQPLKDCPKDLRDLFFERAGVNYDYDKTQPKPGSQIRQAFQQSTGTS